MPVVVITPPEPVLDLEMVKNHLRVDTDDDDALIALYMAAAQAMIDGPAGWLGRAIGVQTLEYRINGFPHPIWGWAFDGSSLFWGSAPNFYPDAGWPCGRIKLPCPPLISVISVIYEDETGADQTLPPVDYLLADGSLDAAYGTTFPSGRMQADAVRIQYQAGYQTVPVPIVAAMMLMVGDLYSNRETTVDARATAAVQVPMSTTVEALLGPYRVFT